MQQDRLNRLRTLQMVAHILIPMIEERHNEAYERLLGDFRNGSTENLARIAECNAYMSLLEEIRFNIAELENYKEE